MPTKKKEELPVSNSNINTNNNTVNVNVNINKPKSNKKKSTKTQPSSSKLFKTIIGVIIAGIITFFVKYMRDVFDGGHGKPAGVYTEPVKEIK